MANVKEQVTFLIQRLVGYSLTIAFLIAFNIIVSKISAVNVVVYEHITIYDIVSIVFYLVIMVLIFLLGKNMAAGTARIFNDSAMVNSLFINITILAMIGFAYKSFELILMPFVDRFDVPWLYPVVFILLAILPVYRLIMVFVSGSGTITQSITSKKEKAGVVITADTVICVNCGEKVLRARYCHQCGIDLKPEIPVKDNICENCNSVMEPESKFCMNCGMKNTDSVSRS